MDCDVGRVRQRGKGRRARMEKARGSDGLHQRRTRRGRLKNTEMDIPCHVPTRSWRVVGGFSNGKIENLSSGAAIVPLARAQDGETDDCVTATLLG
jgi:hypothetical protein